MSITIDSNSRKVILRAKNLKKITREGIEHAAYISGRGLVKTTSAEILKKPKGGKVYVRRTASGRKRRHVASAPGETHANMTGTLRRSLSFRVGRNTLEFGYGVQKNDMPEYGEFVEFGTSKMKARPSLQNGMKKEQRNMVKNLSREIGKRTGARVTI